MNFFSSSTERAKAREMAAEAATTCGSSSTRTCSLGFVKVSVGWLGRGWLLVGRLFK